MMPDHRFRLDQNFSQLHRLYRLRANHGGPIDANKQYRGPGHGGAGATD